MTKKTWAAVALTAMVTALTAAAGVMQTHVDSGAVADVLAQARLTERFTIKTEGPSDVFIIRGAFPQGTDSGWHSHPGTGIFVVTKGVATIYEGNDTHCTPHRVAAGTGAVEQQNFVHLVRNEDATPLEFYFIPLVPAGAPAGVEAPRSDNCPF
jgi:quercetin dioxygenase-like cupin family protein